MAIKYSVFEGISLHTQIKTCFKLFINLLIVKSIKQTYEILSNYKVKLQSNTAC